MINAIQNSFQQVVTTPVAAPRQPVAKPVMFGMLKSQPMQDTFECKSCNSPDAMLANPFQAETWSV